MINITTQTLKIDLKKILNFLVISLLAQFKQSKVQKILNLTKKTKVVNDVK